MVANMKKIIIPIILGFFIFCNSASPMMLDQLRAVIAKRNSGDTIPPTLSTFVIGTDGDTWTFTYSEIVTATDNGDMCDGYTVTMSTAGALTFTYSSGTRGSDSVFTCTGSATVLSGETISTGLDYTQGTIADNVTNALAAIDDKTTGFTNNSTQTAETAPDLWASALSDNAANNTVTATVGSNGILMLNGSSSNTSLAYNADGPSFLWWDDQLAVRSPSLDGDTYFDDSGQADFAIGWDMKFVGNFDGNNRRLISATGNEADLMVWCGTTLCGIDYGSETTSSSAHDAIVADTNWHTYRYVIAYNDTKKAVLYKDGVEIMSTTNTPAIDLSPTQVIKFGGNESINKSIYIDGSNYGYIKNLKIWSTSVNPGE